MKKANPILEDYYINLEINQVQEFKISYCLIGILSMLLKMQKKRNQE